MFRRFSHVWLFVIPKTVACQAPLSPGFSRRGYCSGLPLPPPGDLLHRDWICISRASFTAGRLFTTEPSGSLLSTCVCVLGRSVVSDSATHGLVAHQAPLSRLWKGIHGILQARILEWVAISFSRGSSQPRHWTWVSCTAGGFFTIWATRKAPKNLLPNTNSCARPTARLPKHWNLM